MVRDGHSIVVRCAFLCEAEGEVGEGGDLGLVPCREGRGAQEGEVFVYCEDDEADVLYSQYHYEFLY